MTSYVLLFFVFASIVVGGQCGVVEHNATLASHCMQETHVTQETVDSYLDDPEKEPSEEFFCYLQCVFTGIGMIDENGDLDVELYKSMFTADMDCLKEIPKIVKCTDMEALVECAKD